MDKFIEGMSDIIKLGQDEGLLDDVEFTGEVLVNEPFVVRNADKHECYYEDIFSYPIRINESNNEVIMRNLKNLTGMIKAIAEEIDKDSIFVSKTIVGVSSISIVKDKYQYMYMNLITIDKDVVCS